MNKQETNLLKYWFSQSEGYVEFRFIVDNVVKDTRFIAVEDINEPLLARFSEKGEREGLNVYFGVATRKSRSGTEKDVLYVPGLWLDIDPKHAPYEKAMQIVSQLPTPPSATISSGNGVHAYFKFNEPFVVNNDDDLQFIKEYSKKLHTFANADDTFDMARLLRVPNSFNVKDLKDIKLCSVVEITGATYSLDSFDYLSAVELKSSATALEKVKITDFTSIELEDMRVSTYIKRLIVGGAKEGERSEKIFAVTCSLLENEHTAEEIAYVLTNPDWGISDKILGRPGQHQIPYIEGAINKATQRINDNSVDTSNPSSTIECSIYEHNNCYYEDDKRLSNFIFVPKERVVLPSTELLKGEVVLQHGETLQNVILTPKSLSSKNHFTANFTNTKTSWIGGDKQVQRLKELFLSKKITEKQGVDKIGLHGDVFITPSETISAEGIVENSPYTYVPKFIEEPMDLERHIKMPMVDNWEEIVKEILPLLCRINEDASIATIIGWHFITPIAPLIRKVADNNFPQLMIWGTKGSGKTSTAQVFGKLFGNPEVRSCARPGYSALREVDLFNALPIYLDEFRPHNMPSEYVGAIKDIALNAYKATPTSRGTKSLGTVTYYPTAPIVWMGETPFEESNLMERIVITKLSPNVLAGANEYKKAYRALNLLPLKYFMGGYIQWLLSKVQNGEINIRDLYETYREMLDDYFTLNERPATNIAITLIGVHLFNLLAAEVNLECRINNKKVSEIQAAYFCENEMHSGLQNLFKFTATIIQGNLNYMERGVHYEYNAAQNKLTLATSLWLSAVRKYAKDYDFRNEVMSEKQLKNLLKEDYEQSGFVIGCGGPRDIGGKSTRSYIIDTQQLASVLDIPTEVWEERTAFHPQN